jgi:hypothetical protein
MCRMMSMAAINAVEARGKRGVDNKWRKENDEEMMTRLK